MVHGADQDVFICCYLYQVGAKHIIRGEVERSLNELFDCSGQRYLIRIDEIAGITQFPTVFIQDLLIRLTVFFGDDCAEYFMPVDDCLECLFQQGAVEFTF